MKKRYHHWNSTGTQSKNMAILCGPKGGPVPIQYDRKIIVKVIKELDLKPFKQKQFMDLEKSSNRRKRGLRNEGH